MIRKSSKNPFDNIWIYGKSTYPCLAIVTNGVYYCVHYFLNDSGNAWQSVGACEQDIIFKPGGEKQVIPGDSVISLEKAIACMNLFFETLQKPYCIEWREL